MPLNKDKEPPIYNSLIHKCGDMVLTAWDNKLIPAILLDDMGRAFLDPTQEEIVAIKQRCRKGVDNDL